MRYDEFPQINYKYVVSTITIQTEAITDFSFAPCSALFSLWDFCQHLIISAVEKEKSWEMHDKKFSN